MLVLGLFFTLITFILQIQKGKYKFNAFIDKQLSTKLQKGLMGKISKKCHKERTEVNYYLIKGINFRRIKFSQELIFAIWLNLRKLVPAKYLKSEN